MSALHDALFAALAAVAPVCNLDAPNEADRTTWRCGFLDTATDDQRAAAAQVLASYTMPAAVPEVISDRQCFQQLAVLGKISADEALAAVTVGALPKVVTDGIAGLPSAQQFPAKMMLCGATEFHRSHAMTPVLGRFLGLDAPGLDALWRAAALL